MSTYLIAFAILLVAAFAQSISGFGYALIAVPLLAVTVDPVVAVITASMVNLAMTVVTWALERRHVDHRATWPLVIGSVIGMPFGLIVLNQLPPSGLTAIIAVVTMACSVIVWRNGRRVSAAPAPPPASRAKIRTISGKSWPPAKLIAPFQGNRADLADGAGGGAGVGARNERRRVLGAGVLSGVLLTATGTNGPPLVAVLQRLGLEPRQFRATLAAIFTISGTIGAVGFWATGGFNAGIVPYIGIGLVAAGLGGWAGQITFTAIDKTRFRQLIIGALVVSSTVALVRAVTGS